MPFFFTFNRTIFIIKVKIRGELVMGSIYSVSNMFVKNDNILLVNFISPSSEGKKAPEFYFELLNSKFQDRWINLEFHELVKEIMGVFSCFGEKRVYIKVKNWDVEKEIVFDNKNHGYPELKYSCAKKTVDCGRVSIDYNRQFGLRYGVCDQPPSISEEEWNKVLNNFASEEVDSMYSIIGAVQEELYPNLVRVEKQLVK